MFTHPFPYAFGLDIGDLSIKLVQLHSFPMVGRRPRYHLRAARSMHLPHGLITNGILEQPEQIRSHLEKIIIPNRHRDHLVKSPWVVASLPDAQGFIKLIQLEGAGDNLVEEDILHAAQKHLPFEQDLCYIDWQIMADDDAKPDTTHVLIAAIPKTIADMYTYLFESLGLGVVALELESLATARAMITAQKVYDDEARAILDLGATHSSFIVYDHNHIQFSVTLAFSGEIVTTAIAQKFHVTYEEAEEKKKHADIHDTRQVLWPIMTSLVGDLSDQIQKAIHFYYSHFPDANKITHITMCGGGAMMKHLDQALTQQLKIEARPGHLWKNLNVNIAKYPSEREAISYATAVGLALRAAQNPFFAGHLL